LVRSFLLLFVRGAREGQVVALQGPAIFDSTDLERLRDPNERRRT
jgi:hypothetical protein